MFYQFGAQLFSPFAQPVRKQLFLSLVCAPESGLRLNPKAMFQQ